MLRREWVDQVEASLRCGQLDRRDFMRCLVLGGISASTASLMAEKVLAQASSFVTDVSKLGEDFEIIIVGAGAAGCVLASRLSIAGKSVLLIEAGGDRRDDPIVTNPRQWFLAQGDPNFDWNYLTTPQDSVGGARVPCPRGRLLGGSASINVMTYLRGMAADYDNWAYDGCPGWDWASVLPHFKRLESTASGNDSHRGRSGQQHLETARGAAHELSLACLEAAKQAGVKETADVNGPYPIGAGYQDMAIKEGRRFGPAEAFLYPAMGRNKLTVLSGARVMRLNIDNGSCVSLEIRTNGTATTLPVTGELVLSAGSIDTPRLLMLSGVGRVDDLAQFGISPLLNHSAMGQNLQDHILIGGVVCETKQDVAAMTTNASEVVITRQLRPGPPVPDIGMPFFQGGFAAPEHRPHVPENSYTLIPGLLRPLARGELRLASANPDTAPLINPNYLGETADMERLLDSIALAREIVNAPAFAPFRKREVLPGAGKSRSSTIEFLKQGLGSWYHPVGTCRMGSDDSAPVDPQSLRLKGTRNIRIADCSIIPTIPSANTMAAAMLIGDKASEMIISSINK